MGAVGFGEGGGAGSFASGGVRSEPPGKRRDWIPPKSSTSAAPNASAASRTSTPIELRGIRRLYPISGEPGPAAASTSCDDARVAAT
jgi:hypothetical protein